MNYCYADVLQKKQKDYLNVKYDVANMFAVMDIGKERKTQQDSVLILQHPKNNIKLIALADGMGGLQDGSIASNLALLKISKWFLSDLNNVNNLNLMKEQIYNLLDSIDLYIRKNCNGGTTLACAIVFKSYTIFFNVGDSRIYIKNNNEFYQLSEDHSITWNLYKSKIIRKKDDIRFHKKNNLILSRLGCENKLLTIDYKILSNECYDNIYLFTDGITDCLSDSQIYNIIRNNSEKYAASDIINNASNIITYNSSLLTDEYYDRIVGGKDNMSVIVLKNGRMGD